MFTMRCGLAAGAAELKSMRPVRAAILQRGRGAGNSGGAGPGLEVPGGTGQKRQREREKVRITPSSDGSVPTHVFLPVLEDCSLYKGAQEGIHFKQ